MDKLLELYRTGLSIGIRRGSGSTVSTAFSLLWDKHKGWLLSYGLRMITLDEHWGVLPLADSVCNVAQTTKNDADKRDTIFGFIQQLTKARSNRMAYYLTRACIEPWVEIKDSILSRQIPKKEWLLTKKSMGNVTDKTFWTPLGSAVKNDEEKQSYINSCKELSELAGNVFDRQLPRVAAILAVIEPSFPEMSESMNAGMINFRPLSDAISWNYVHPDSYVGQHAIARVADTMKIRKEEIRLNWLFKYIDQSVNPERSFWQSVYETKANVKTKSNSWHMMAVALMAECQKWIDTHRE